MGVPRTLRETVTRERLPYMFYTELWDDEEHGSPNSATETIAVKVSRNQLAAIHASGEAVSQWVRGAIDERLQREGIQAG
jgi:hypothetical protein